MENKREFEMFCDTFYYGMWCVRPVGDREFNSFMSFHFADKKDAEKFKELAEKAK